MNRSMIKKSFLSTLPVMAGYLVLGIGFGILLEENGCGLLWAAAMSIFIYAGSMQYVAINLMSGGATLISTAIMTVMVNARHLFYGISMVDKYKNAGKKKPFLMFALTDETYSLVCNADIEDEKERHSYYFWCSLFDYLYWIIGSILGNAAGSVIPFNTAGIEFSMTALFVVVFTEQWLESKNHTSALVGVFSSLLCRVIFGSNFIIPSMIVITVILTVFRKRLEKEEK